jgi:hypothetical protein
MKRIIPLTLLSLLFAVPVGTAGARDPDRYYRGPWYDRDWSRSDWYAPPDSGPPARIPNLNGTWYMRGNPDQPCRIIQRRPDGRALFINENGSRAEGFVRGDHVFVPDWNNGRGERGRIQGDRILWPGSYWSRNPRFR